MIDRVDIEGFKSLERVTIPMKGLNVLSGANAVGKSSFIQGLLLLRQSIKVDASADALALSGELFDAGMASEVIRLGAETLSIQLISKDGTRKYVFPAPAATSRDERWMSASATIDALPNCALFSDPSQNLFSYLCAERVGPRSSQSLEAPSSLAGPVGLRGEFTYAFLRTVGPEGEARPVHDCWARVLPLIYEEAAKATPRLRKDDFKEQRLVSNITEWVLAWFFPETSYSVVSHKRLGVVEPSVSNSRFVRNMRPTNLGFGVSYVLPVVAAGLGLAPNGLLLVENPEAHLNPRAQSQVGMFLAACVAAGAQLVVETHSDHVVNGIRLAVKRGWLEAGDVLFHHFTKDYEKDSSAVQSISSDKDGRLSAWPTGFFDQLEADLSELF